MTKSRRYTTIVCTDGGFPAGAGNYPLLKNDATSGNNYLDFRESRNQHAKPTWRSFTRKAQVEGTQAVDWDNRTYVVVAKRRDDLAGSGGCIFSTWNGWTYTGLGANYRNQIWLSNGDFSFREYYNDNHSQTLNVSTTNGLTSDWQIFVATVSSGTVKLYVNDTTSLATGATTATAISGNDTLTPLFFSGAWDYNTTRYSNNEYNESLGEIAIYDRPLTTEELDTLFTDLKAKWAIT